MTNIVKEQYSNISFWQKNVTSAINNILNGKVNSISTLTLTASATSTTINDLRCTASSVVYLMPTTASARTALNGSYITVTKQSFTVSHSSYADTDMDFNYAILG